MVFETFQCTAPQFQTHTRLKTSRSRSRSAPAHRIESAMRSAGCCEPSCARSCAAACRRGNLKALPCNPAPSRRLQQHTPPPPLFNSNFKASLCCDCAGTARRARPGHTPARTGLDRQFNGPGGGGDGGDSRFSPQAIACFERLRVAVMTLSLCGPRPRAPSRRARGSICWSSTGCATPRRRPVQSQDPFSRLALRGAHS